MPKGVYNRKNRKKNHEPREVTGNISLAELGRHTELSDEVRERDFLSAKIERLQKLVDFLINEL